MLPSQRHSDTSWLWPVLFVTALHLLSTAGTWWVTDHGEILAVADRFLSAGRLDLRDLGAGWEDWTRIASVRGSFETRFLPLSILSLTPLLALDHLVGWTDPSSFHFVHLQGHLFVGIGLALVGRFAARTAGGPSAAALVVLLLGLNWPVWMIARRLGPEPILFCLLSLFATGGTRSRLGALLVLPWVHASGPILGLGALLWLRFEPRAGSNPSMRIAILGWIAGVSSLALLWNLPVHGQPFLGGYGRLSDGFFVLQNPVAGVLRYFVPMFLWTLPMWMLAFRHGRRALAPTVGLWLPMLAFFGLFSSPEPERRLVPLLGAWAITVLPGRSGPPSRQRVLLFALALFLGLLGLSRDFVDAVPTPFGVYSGPFLLVVRLAFVNHEPLVAGGLLVLVLGAAWAAGSHALQQLQGLPKADADADQPDGKSATTGSTL